MPPVSPPVLLRPSPRQPPEPVIPWSVVAVLLYAGLAGLVAIFLGVHSFFGNAVREPYSIHWVLLALELNAGSAAPIRAASLALAIGFETHLWLAWRSSARRGWVRQAVFVCAGVLVATMHVGLLSFLRHVPHYALVPVF